MPKKHGLTVLGTDCGIGINEDPYRKLEVVHLKTGAVENVINQKTYLVRARKVMEIIVNHSIETHTLNKSSYLYEMSYVCSRAIFNESFLHLAKLSYKIDIDTIVDRKRLGDINYLTIYDRLNTDKKRKANLLDV